MTLGQQRPRNNPGISQRSVKSARYCLKLIEKLAYRASLDASASPQIHSLETNHYLYMFGSQMYQLLLIKTSFKLIIINQKFILLSSWFSLRSLANSSFCALFLLATVISTPRTSVSCYMKFLINSKCIVLNCCLIELTKTLDFSSKMSSIIVFCSIVRPIWGTSNLARWLGWSRWCSSSSMSSMSTLSILLGLTPKSWT